MSNDAKTSNILQWTEKTFKERILRQYKMCRVYAESKCLVAMMPKWSNADDYSDLQKQWAKEVFPDFNVVTVAKGYRSLMEWNLDIRTGAEMYVEIRNPQRTYFNPSILF